MPRRSWFLPRTRSSAEEEEPVLCCLEPGCGVLRKTVGCACTGHFSRAVRVLSAAVVHVRQGLKRWEHRAFGFLYDTSTYTRSSTRDTGRYALLDAGNAHWRGLPAAPRLLVVGYLTSEWGDNSVGKEMAAVLQSHNTRRLQVRCYALGARMSPSRDSLMWRDRAQRHCTGGLQDLADTPSLAAARVINEQHVHILIDLNGWMPGHRASILALSPAPVQASM